MTLHLRITKAPEGTTPPQSVHAFDEQGGTLGRGPGNTWVLPDPDRILSGRHCELVCEQGRYQIVDHSTNGTFINRSAEPLGKGSSALLKHGDQVEVGDYCFVVEVTEPQGAAPDSPFADAAVSEPEPAPAMPDDPFASDPFAETPLSLSGQESLDPLQALDGAGSSPSFPERPEPLWEGAEGPMAEAPAATPFAEGSAVPEPPSMPESMPGSDPGAEAVHWPESRPENLIPDDWLDDVTDTGGGAAAPATPPPESEPEPAPEARAVTPEPEPVAARAPDASDAVRETPVPGPAKGGEANRASDAVFEAMGVDLSRLSEADREALDPLLGRLMREVVEGLMQVLRSRASIKNEFRMNVTTIQPVENNPLKFSADVDEALENIFTRRSQAYKEPLSAVREGFQEIAEHQLAMIAGMRSAFEHMLRDFDPERLETRFDRERKPGALPAWQRTRYWKQYREYYQGLSDNIERSFQQIFGDEFVQAYQDQLRRLSSLRPS